MEKDWITEMESQRICNGEQVVLKIIQPGDARTFKGIAYCKGKKIENVFVEESFGDIQVHDFSPGEPLGNLLIRLEEEVSRVLGGRLEHPSTSDSGSLDDIPPEPPEVL